MSETFDVIVIGLGGMGSASLHHLAVQGVKVLGLEQFNIPHHKGSSHGETRIIRLAYFEHPSYVPLLKRSYELWDKLEKDSDRKLFYQTGSMDIGAEDSRCFTGSLESCRLHKLPHEVLTAQQIKQRFPGYDLPANFRAVFQPNGGFLVPEACITAHVQVALAHGAKVHAREKMLSYEADAKTGIITVKTDKGTYKCKKLCITAGAWLGKLLPNMAQYAVPERQVLGWFDIKQSSLKNFTPNTFPVFNLELPQGHFYGFPAHNVLGFKIGKYHHRFEVVDPDTMNRDADEKDEVHLREIVSKYFPQADGPVLSLETCMFTNSPDKHFIIDKLPAQPNVVIAGGFSGHGFKFASVVGEIVADLAVKGQTKHDIDLFRIERLYTAKPVTHVASRSKL